MAKIWPPLPTTTTQTHTLLGKPSFIEGEVPTMRSPVTFKTKLYVTTVSSLQPIFCHKELHPSCCIRLELNIVAWSSKILKDIGGLPPWLSANLGKYMKNSPSYNQFHNILRLFDVLPNFPFTTSETMGDYYL